MVAVRLTCFDISGTTSGLGSIPETLSSHSDSKFFCSREQIELCKLQYLDCLPVNDFSWHLQIAWTWKAASSSERKRKTVLRLNMIWLDMLVIPS